jgi:hypothetical protein
MKKVPRVCRVCGINFTAPRFDAKTCSSTCRSRLRRGGDLAYLNHPDLPRGYKRTHRKMHAAYDAAKAAHRKAVTATRKVREEDRKLKQKLKQQKADEERERLLDEITGHIYRQQQAAARRQGQLSSVAGCLKFLTRERRNDFSAEAIAALLDSEYYPVEEIAERLDELKASGDYDRILAEASAIEQAAS